MNVTAANAARPTRGRILDAALELFAVRGYEATTVAELERASGLSPGSGALYRHFASKRELLDAALAARLDAIEEMRSQLALAPLGDLRAELAAIGRWGLAELERERLLVAILMREGGAVPELTAGFRAAVVETGHGIAVELLERWAAARDVRIEDTRALAIAVTSSLVGFALQGQMLGRDFARIGDKRFIAAWVELAASVIENATTNKGMNR